MDSPRFCFATLLLLVPCSATPPCSAEALSRADVAVRFELDLKVKPAALPRGVLELKPDGGKGEALSLPIEGGSIAGTALPKGSRWEAEGTAPGFWIRRESVVVPVDGRPVVVRLITWPLGKVTGSARLLEPKEKRPTALLLSTLANPWRKSEAPPGVFSCPLDDKGRWACEIPTATYDLALSAEGYVPRYVWGVTPVSGRAVAVGDVELEKGASVAGWAAADGSAIDPASCQARLVPATAAGTTSEGQARARERALTAPVRKDGFFQLSGVPSGTYLLEVAQSGFAPARIQSLGVWPGAETFLREPLVLHRPMAVKVAIHPALDWLNHPWRVTLVRAADDSGSFVGQTQTEGAASEEGLLTVEGQSPGRFLIQVRDSAGSTAYVDPAAWISAEMPISIDIQTVWVKGELTLAKRPLAATLWFGGRNGAPSARLDSDETGQFQGPLPKSGRWALEIEAAEPEIRVTKSVTVSPNRNGDATLEINLPDTHVFGRVMLDDGRPATTARVLARTANESLPLEVDSVGKFDLRAVEDGWLDLEAQARTQGSVWRGDKVGAVVSEDREVGPLLMTLHKGKLLRGRLVSALGLVPGARVTISDWTAGTLGYSDTAQSNADGTFSAFVSASAQSALVLVAAPGHALRVARAPIQEEPIALEVPALGGALSLDLEDGIASLAEKGLHLWVFQNDAPLSFLELWKWAQSKSGGSVHPKSKVLTIANLGPGAYQACLIPARDEATWQAAGWSREGDSCAGGELAPGGGLSLDAPEREGRGRPALTRPHPLHSTAAALFGCFPRASTRRA